MANPKAPDHVLVWKNYVPGEFNHICREPTQRDRSSDPVFDAAYDEYVHAVVGCYLLGLYGWWESKYGKDKRPRRPWDRLPLFKGFGRPGSMAVDSSAAEFLAIKCIRDAVAHNDRDANKNRDTKPVGQVEDIIENWVAADLLEVDTSGGRFYITLRRPFIDMVKFKHLVLTQQAEGWWKGPAE